MSNTLQLSKRGQSVPPSPIRDLMAYAEEAKTKGVKVYHLNIGDPDFPMPDEIKETLQSLSQSIVRLPYPGFRGQKDVLNAWQAYYKGIGFTDIKHEDLLVTAGASDGLVLAAATITDPDDEIIVFEPFFAPYLTHASFISTKLIPVSLNKENGYHLPSKEEIISKISSKTKAILFTNPNNPTGTVFTHEEITHILDIAKEHKLFVISDEAYRGMVFDGRESLSILHVADKTTQQQIIVVDSVSKRLNVCGARMGVIVSKNQEIMAAAFRFAQGRPYPAYLEQELVAPMLKHCLEYVSEISKNYQKRRDIFITALEKNLGTNIHQPEGAFYTMLSLPVDNTNSFAKWMLTDFEENNETVMITPGSGFYATPGKGIQEIRVAFVLHEKDLKRSAELLALGVREYNSKKR